MARAIQARDIGSDCIEAIVSTNQNKVDRLEQANLGKVFVLSMIAYDPESGIARLQFTPGNGTIEVTDNFLPPAIDDTSHDS